MAEITTRELEKLQCGICLEILTDPRALPCGHLFCFKKCIEKLNKSVTIVCPMCRSSHSKASVFSTSLRKPLYGLKEFLEVIKSSAIKKENTIERALACSKHCLPIEFFCSSCNICSCKSCFQSSHQKHTIESLENYLKDVNASLKQYENDITSLRTTRKRHISVCETKIEIENEKLRKLTDLKREIETTGSDVDKYDGEIKSLKHSVNDRYLIPSHLDQIAETLNQIPSKIAKINNNYSAVVATNVEQIVFSTVFQIKTYDEWTAVNVGLPVFLDDLFLQVVLSNNNPQTSATSVKILKMEVVVKPIVKDSLNRLLPCILKMSAAFHKETEKPNENRSRHELQFSPSKAENRCTVETVTWNEAWKSEDKFKFCCRVLKF